MAKTRTIRKLLVANRGEIALRVMLIPWQSCKPLGEGDRRMVTNCKEVQWFH